MRHALFGFTMIIGTSLLRQSIAHWKTHFPRGRDESSFEFIGGVVDHTIYSDVITPYPYRCVPVFGLHFIPAITDGAQPF